MSFNIFSMYWDLAVNTYHVDPRIFVMLVVASIPFYWYGWLKIGKEVLHFRSKLKADKKKKLIQIFDEKGFLSGLSINRFAWILPYIYVIFWGRNIPWWFWILFFGWMAFGAYIFWHKIKQMLRPSDD